MRFRTITIATACAAMLCAFAIATAALTPATAKPPANPSASGKSRLTECGLPGHRLSLTQWPRTDFTRCLVPLAEIISGGPGKDGIPAINDPAFIPVADETALDPREPVISLAINGAARAWPLRYLIWHEIANDTLGGVPVSVTYCPLCNTAIVFDRRFGGAVLDFGTTGNLRKSDLVMYDRQTETWWQQYTGEAIVGFHAGATLTRIPSRLESWEQYKTREAGGTVMAQPAGGTRAYGVNPYLGYDSAAVPFLYDGSFPEGIAPLARVVVVEDGAEAYALTHLARRKTLTTKSGVVLEWKAGQRSVLDTRTITDGRDVGTVIAMRDGAVVDYKVTFAFVYHAFMPEGEIIGK